MDRVVGVIPAAGYASRLQPLTGSKEVLVISGKPLMDFLIERMRVAGCEDLRVVTRPEKMDVIAHAERRNLTVVRAYPRTVSESLLCGLGDTDPHDIVLIGFPDTIWEPLDGFVRLLEALPGFEVALGLFQWAEAHRSDVVQFADSGVVTSIQVRPQSPASNWIWGMAAARRQALAALTPDGEPGAVFNTMCARGAIVGVPLRGSFADIGTPEALEAYVGSQDL